MPAEQVGPEQLLRHVEHHRPQHRPPQRAAPAHDRHQHHPHAEGGAGEGNVQRIDEADEVAVGAAGQGQERRGHGPRHDLAARGGQPHRLRLVLVVADGVEQQPEAAPVQQPQHAEADPRQRQKIEAEEAVAVAQRGRQQRRDQPRAGAQEVDAVGDFARRHPQPQRADREVMAAQAQDAAAQQHRQRHRRQQRARQPQPQAAQVGRRRQVRHLPRAAGQLALHHRGGVHPGSEEHHVAERVVAHLAAGDVPGQRQDHHHPQHRHLRLELGRNERPRNTGRRHQQRPPPLPRPGIHSSTLRRRASSRLRSSRITTSSENTNAV